MADLEKLPQLTFSLSVSNGIPVEQISRSLNDKDYKHFIRNKYGAKFEQEALVLYKVREGSQVFDFLSLLACSTPFMFAEAYTTLGDFFGYMRRLYEYLRFGKELEKELDREELINMIAIMTANQKQGDTLHLEFHDKVNIKAENIIVNHKDASIVINNARRELDALQAPQTQVQNNQIVVFTQLNSHAKSDGGNLAIVPSVSTSLRNTTFASHEIRNAVLQHRNLNPFAQAFVADIEVVSVEGKPDVYKVLHVHRSLDVTDVQASDIEP
jgi:hypothetical protein